MVASPRYRPQSCTTRLEVTTTERRNLGLQDLSGVFTDAPGQEQVVEHQQVRRHPVLGQLSAFSGANSLVG